MELIKNMEEIQQTVVANDGLKPRQFKKMIATQTIVKVVESFKNIYQDHFRNYNWVFVLCFAFCHNGSGFHFEE